MSMKVKVESHQTVCWRTGKPAYVRSESELGVEEAQDRHNSQGTFIVFSVCPFYCSQPVDNCGSA